MPVFNWLITACWLVFIVYWGISALSAKKYVRRSSGSLLARLVILVVFVALWQLPGIREAIAPTLTQNLGPAVESLGVVLCALGIGLAVWARVYLGRNWGMPMSLKQNAELVTGGPYAYIRHPIYSGAILAMLGSALGASLYWLIAFVTFGIYFIYSATVEEKIMLKEFPDAYPTYKKRTYMLIPFVL